VVATILRMSSFYDISFSITIKPKLALFGKYIDHVGYISASYVSPDLDLILLIYGPKVIQVFVIQSVSPLLI